MIMCQLEKLKKEAEIEFGMKFSVLFCGDFNSTPPFGVLEFMRQKIIDENHADWRSAEGMYSFFLLTLVDRYIRTGNFQKNYFYLSLWPHTQDSETNNTSFESLNIGLLELVVKVGVAVI